jgi:hypothetical protein
VKVADLQTYLTSLSDLLLKNHSAGVGKEFKEFCNGLAPFKDFSVPQLAKFMADVAEEYKRTGQVRLPPAGGARATRTARPRAKTSDDIEAVQKAAEELQALYNRAGDPALTYPQITQVVARISTEFDKGGLIAVAIRFGVSLNSRATGKLAQAKIEERITTRKGQLSENQDIAQATTAGVPQAAPRPQPALAGERRLPDAQPAPRLPDALPVGEPGP